MRLCIRMPVTVALVSILACAAPGAWAQESQFESDLRREKEHITEACDEFSFTAAGSCAYTLVTGYPFHLALGSLAPQNGFAFGLAFSERFTPNEAWRLSWNADAVATLSGSWRGGAYMKLIHTPATSGIVVRPGGPATTPAPVIAPREFAVIDLFAQIISLETLDFFGPGPDSSQSGRSAFAERQTIVGGAVTYPLTDLRAIAALRPALVGGIYGRFVDIQPGSSDGVPSIEQVYDEGSAPGLARQTAFVEFEEGVRFKPSVANGAVGFNYLFAARQFRTDGATQSSFNRWIADLQHEIPLYRRASSTGPRAFNGPNECTQSIGSNTCPPVQWSRNRQGTIVLRLLVSAASTSEANRVPFYFQPTLGGSDIDGERRLASYDDYRFRGANLILLQESIEHSLWGPLGVFVQAEQGKVAATRSDLDLGHLRTSTTVGLTLRAGGFPMVNLSFSWGGEGHHVIAAMNTSLLGGSARPRLQ